jgi:hypothetical protein
MHTMPINIDIDKSFVDVRATNERVQQQEQQKRASDGNHLFMAFYRGLTAQRDHFVRHKTPWSCRTAKTVSIGSPHVRRVTSRQLPLFPRKTAEKVEAVAWEPLNRFVSMDRQSLSQVFRWLV